MSKHKITICLPTLLLSLHLGYPILAQSGAPKPGTATVSGRVTAQSELARGVGVVMQPQQQSHPPSPSAVLRVKADEHGRFRFTGVAAGKYTISAFAPGYVSPADDLMGRRGQNLNVAEGENVENVSLEIKRGGVIAGRLTDSRGHPVVEETVTLNKLDQSGNSNMYWINDQYNQMYLTDDRGEYRIFGLPEGRYLVSVGQEQKPGSAGLTWRDLFYPRVYYPNATSKVEAKVIEVTEGSEATDIDITVPDPKKPYSVYGRVVDADTGKPVPVEEFTVRALTQDGKPIGGGTAIGEGSGPNGEFHLRVVTPGKYALMVNADGGDDNGFISEPVIFDIIEGDVTGVEVKVRQAGSISGAVVIEGTSDPKILSKLSQIKISSFYRSIKSTLTGRMPIAAGIADVKVNADGGFRISGLQPGNVFIQVRPSPDIRGLTVARIERDRVGLMASDGVDVGAGTHVTGVRIVMVYSARAVRGEVKVVGGALPADLKFSATARRVDQPTQALLSADVDARGQFLIEGAPPGEYEIGLFPRLSPYSERLAPQTLRLISSLKERVVVAGDNPQPVVLLIDLSRKEGNQ